MSQVQEQEIRGLAIDNSIKQTAAVTYKFKQALLESSTASWQNRFYRETTTSSLTGQSGNAIQGVPRLALPARNSVDWEVIDSFQDKFFFEDEISWEDIITNNIAVQARTIFRISEGVTYAVDNAIYTALTDTTANTGINVVQIASGLYWDGSSGAIFDVLGNARQLIKEDGYDPTGLICFVSPKDERSINSYLVSKGAQFPNRAEDTLTNGKMGTINGITFVVANNVTASQALVCIPKVCGEWKVAAPLQTNITEDPFRSVKIRAVEIGVTHVTDPKAICIIKGTQGSF